uniref:Integrase, catalytic region, zinc finger, CCHC-type, peptidase aspartic, catalytic n=1 Tax=Tanacetum cinerariifolium TaxID=118510 RepID=A0A6L2L350_TANCI|nr:integrase, catalytic region, zinc finger, CCHC-type, peptidase aspartic, catalytic [Tanacetum cinerariifolium]
MGDENPIRTLGVYSKPSHEGYKNTIELAIRNNMVPFRSVTIRLVQNGCAFHGLQSEDPNQHLKGRTTKLRNDILMFQQHHRESLSEVWTRFKTDDELTKKELKQIEADDQAIQTILLSLPEDNYKKAKFFNEWERFTSNEGESIESYYHRFLKLMNDLKRNKHFSEKIATPHQDQPSFNQNYMQQPIPNLEDIIDPITTMNMELTLIAKAFKPNYSTPSNNNQRISLNPRNRKIAQLRMNMGQDRHMQMNGLIGFLGNANLNGNGNLVAARAKGNAAGHNGNQIRCYNCRGKEEAGIQLQADEFDLMVAAVDLDEIEEVNANYILMANLQQASTSEEQYTELLKPIPESHQVPQNDNTIIFEVTSVEQSREIVEQHLANVEETHLNNQLSKEKSTVSFLHEEKKKLKSDFKTHEDELLDKQIQLEKKIKELNNILVKTGQLIQKIHMLSPKPDSFYHTEPKMALEESLQLAQESGLKMKQLNKEIKPANYTKINHLSGEVAKFVGDFKSLTKEADESVAKHKALELKIKRLLRAVVSQDIMFVVQKASVVDTSNLQNELERIKERFENCIIKKENEYAKLWNDWYKKYTLNPLSQKLENENVELEFQDYKRGTSANTKFAKQSIMENLPKVGETHALSKLVTSNSVPTPQESKVVKNDKVIVPGMFRINPFKTSREEKHVPNKVRASARTKPITVSQPPVITKKDVNSDSNGLSSTGIDNTKTKKPQPRSNTKIDRVPSASKSSQSKNKGVEVEEHHRNLLLSKNMKHMSSTCNNIKIDSQNVISKVVCAMCKQCLISVNHDVCLHNYVNGKTYWGKKQKANVSIKEKQKKHQPKVKKTKKVGFIERLATPKPRKYRFFLRWSPTERLFDLKGKIIDSSESESQLDCSNGDNACTSNTLEPKIKRFPNSTYLLGRVYFVEGLGHNLFSVGQFCDSDLEVAFRRNACFVRNLEGVDLLKRDRSTNLYTINLHEMASASPICLMARASSTKSWL